MCCACKFCVVFVLLPALCAVCVSPVLCLLNVQCTANTVCRAGATTSPIIITVFYFAIFCTTASTVCCTCKSCDVFTLLPVQCAVCVLVLYCVCTTANAVSCVCIVCKSCDVFTLLPVQCAVCVSPVLCLHYCQRSVLCM